VTSTFHHEGFDIPVHLAELTGGGPETWRDISIHHMDEYARYSPISSDQSVLEIGCGVGRDAIMLAQVLGSEGSYVGIDIIAPSIEWCQNNIAARYPNFRFVHLDIKSQIHNADGVQEVRDIRLPVANRSMDRIILQSVFTHMFEDDIVHYLREFRRILRPGGVVFASFFLYDDESVQMARDTGQPLTFHFPYGEGCFINDEQYPEGAVAYEQSAFNRILERGGMALQQPMHRGAWCGRTGMSDGQDVAILSPVRRSALWATRARKSLRGPQKAHA
jgi:SAM-dependent methyltransferase